MSQFRTVVDIKESNKKIGYHSNILFVGSCFAENIGNKFADSKFNALINPFGIVYNPVSVANTLKTIIEKKHFSEDDLVYNNIWNSFYHHSKFSDENKQKCLDNINDACQNSYQFLKNTDFLIITFGTSWVFEYLESGKVVSNCHKIPANKFKRYRLSVDYIADVYRSLISDIRQINPDVEIIFTVSPVRHWKDGAHGNQLSKAVLHLAIDKIVDENTKVNYFPSYELVMDDLRDYRFYNEDMLHVSDVAVNYIWERFINTFIDNKSQAMMVRVGKLMKALGHRPFSADSNTYVEFLSTQLKKIEQLKRECPHINFDEEINFIKKMTEK